LRKFIDRQQEMAVLEKEYRREGSSFVVIYGRRRVGKTALINRFCEGKRSIYFLATEESEGENRNAFKELVSDSLQNRLLGSASLTQWEPIFQVIAEESKKSKIVLVIDEFQYLGKANAAFPSVLQKIWDQFLGKENVMLILCGSLIHMMTSQILNYGSPLYGRRTAQIKMGQIDFAYYHEFEETLTMDECVQHYAVTGGVPKYIELFEGKKNIYKGIADHILNTGAFLYAEPEFLLQKEVTEIGSYFSLLKTIAAGNHKLGKIATVMEVTQSRLSAYLRNLIELDLLVREVPVTEENPAKSKLGLYRIKDNFITFWFRFIYPNKGMIESGHIDDVKNKIENHFIEQHVAFVYEDICRQDAWGLLSEKISFNRLGRWWGNKDVEIDLLAYDTEGKDILFGECKYSTQKKGMEVLRDLQQKAKSVPWNRDARRESYLLYSRSGFTKELEEYAEHQPNLYLRKLV